MKKLLLLILPVAFLGCNQAPPVQNANIAADPQRTERTETVTAHTTENQKAPMPNANSAPNGAKTKWSQSGDPIDVRELNAVISKAVINLREKPADETAKKTLGEAYFKRGFALTEARQYASALGDYRKALKLSPSNEEAKQWIAQIVQIYDSMNKEYPKEGEEPPPLPFDGEKGKK